MTASLERSRTLACLVATLAVLAAHAAAPGVASTSLVLEEVLEHGPLFDELEDEAWWSGVDVIDTALPSASSRFWSSPDSGAVNVFALGVESGYGWVESAPEPGRDEFCRFWSETDACPAPSKESASFSAPRLPPPPPVPPGLGDLIRQLQQRNQLKSTPVDEDDCLLCQWAALNGTVDLVPNSELSSDNSWVPMLVVVALGSAMLGAVLMITALKCRRLKVLPRGGSCPTLPVGYMVGEGKEGVVQTNVPADIDTISKAYTIRSATVGQDAGTLGRPRLGTPTLMHHHDVVQGHAAPVNKQKAAAAATASNERWPIKFWRKVTGAARDDPYAHHDPYLSVADQSDAVSAVYAELNSVSGSAAAAHRAPSVALYHLNTYSEIREPHALQPPCATTIPHPQHAQTAATLHLRRLLSDGTYENAAYALERGVILVEHDAASSSTPSSAYYSDLSNSDRSGSLHNHVWHQRHQAHRPRIGSESHLSAQSLPYAHHHHPHHGGHCCHHHHYLHHHVEAQHDDDSILRPVRDLMPVALSVVPDNQQVPIIVYDDGSFPRGSLASSSLRGTDDGSCKRPLPPLPSRQQQRPQRRFAYAVDPQQPPHQQADQSGGSSSTGSDSSSTLSCVPSEYV